MALFTIRVCYCFIQIDIHSTSKPHKYSARLRMIVNFTVSILPMASPYAICSCSTICMKSGVHVHCTRTKYIYICIYFDVLRHLFPTNRLHAGVFKWFERFCCSMLEFVISMRVEWNLLRIRNTWAHAHTKLHDNFYWWGHPTPKITIIIMLQIAIAIAIQYPK